MSGDSDETKGAAGPNPAQPSSARPGPAQPSQARPAGGEAAAARPADAAQPGEPAKAGSGGAPDKGRKGPAQRKSGKRKIKAKPKFQAGPVQSPAGTPNKDAASGAARAQPAPPVFVQKPAPDGRQSAEAGGPPAAKAAAKPSIQPPVKQLDKPAVATPSGAAKAAAPLTADKVAEPDAKGAAPSAATAAADRERPTPPQAIAANIERSAALSEPAERRGSSAPWLLLLLAIVIAAGGYWLWKTHGAELMEAVVGPQQAPQDGSQSKQLEEVELPGPPALPLAQIAELEELLAQLSLDPGDVDGIVDDRTREAIRQFQEMGDLPVDGEPSEDLLAALREVAGFQSDGG